MIIAIDIGTTNLKAGLYDLDGSAVVSHSVPMKQEIDEYDVYYFDPQFLWKNIAEKIREIAESHKYEITAISIASMAESGLLINPGTGQTATKIIPWFETSSAKQASFIEDQLDRVEQFCKTGLYPSYKQGLSKLLWLKEKSPEIFTQDVVWISVSSYIAFCLTNKIAEERSLAVRTFAYDIRKQAWNRELISYFGFQSDLFPDVQACTTSVGPVLKEWTTLGLSNETNVYIAGHDHLVASLSIGEAASDNIYNSIGTAETLIGTFPKRELTDHDAVSGLTFGMHLLEDTYYWMGGHSFSGGSVEWMRSIISDDTLTYSEVNQLLEQINLDPTGIIFFPYLNGSGAPNPDPEATASFIGITKKHRKRELLKGVLEGNAYQMEWIREAAEMITNTPIKKLTAVGGGIRNKHWMQIKSTVSGIPLHLPEIKEAVSKGAVLVAATGEGIYSSLREAAAKCAPANVEIIQPDKNGHNVYQSIYRYKYKMLVHALNRN